MAGHAGPERQAQVPSEELNGSSPAEQRPSPNGRPVAARPPSRTGQMGRIKVLGAAAFLGGLVGLVGLIVVTAVRNQGRLPPLTPAAFSAAQQQWARIQPPDYEITIEVGGRQSAVYHVQVRDGEVVRALRDGAPLRQQRTMGTWSVPGMFATMQVDVDNLERHQAGTADAGTPQLKLYAAFDPQYGYPARYHRTELRKFGNNYEVFWAVTAFEVQ